MTLKVNRGTQNLTQEDMDELDKQEEEQRQKTKSSVSALLDGFYNYDGDEEEEDVVEEDVVEEDEEEEELEEIEEDELDEEEEVETDEEEELDEEEDLEEELEDEDEDEEDEEEDDEISALRQKVADLSSTINSLESQLSKRPTEEEDDGEGEKKRKDYIDSEDRFEEITASRESFNEFLSEFAGSLKDEFMGNLPDIVNQQVEQEMTAKRVVNDFYEANPDLKPYNSFVQHVATELASENPDWGTQKLFNEAAKESRKQLKLGERDDVAQERKSSSNGKKKKSEGKKGSKPAFAGGSKGKRAASGGNEEAEGVIQSQVSTFLKNRGVA